MRNLADRILVGSGKVTYSGENRCGQGKHGGEARNDIMFDLLPLYAFVNMWRKLLLNMC